MRRLLSWPARWLDARIDARIARAALDARRASEIDWWSRLPEKDRRFWVEHRPELLTREEVARWAA